MSKRTKTPVQIHEQFCRVFDYISNKDWANGKPSDDILKKHGAFLEKLMAVTWGYIDNIYNLAGVPLRPDCSADKANDIWFNFHATKEQYVKG